LLSEKPGVISEKYKGSNVLEKHGFAVKCCVKNDRPTAYFKRLGVTLPPTASAIFEALLYCAKRQVG